MDIAARLATIILIPFLVCTPISAQPTDPTPIRTLTGEPLPPLSIPPDRRAALEADLSAAKAAYDANPRDEAAIIWYGRRLGYLGDFTAAIEVFSKGLQIHPDSYRLLRHRGHRYITTRQFALAEADLRRGAELVADAADTVEPDGAPNDANTPVSTDKSSIDYHLGLVLYLQGKFAESDRVFARREGLAGYNDDMLVSTTHWRYHCLRRTGHHDEAAALLEAVNPDLKVIENQTYFKLCLYYKGLIPESDLLPEAPGATLNGGAAYGIAAKRAEDGDAAGSQHLLRRITAETDWIGFGRIAAEADLARTPAPSIPPIEPAPDHP
ncbi:MAG: hypothetical protein KF745_13860 [Phycisphaeraceae bacterium]|nr:hypothetical protein [Phycisphaeraceae bacterium]